MADKQYSGQDVYNAFKQTRIDLFNSVEQWRKYGIELALSERDYRIAYRAEVFLLHAKDGVAWTAAVEIARGEESTVADLRYTRDVKKVQYEAEGEKVNVLKIETRILENEMKAGLQNGG